MIGRRENSFHEERQSHRVESARGYADSPILVFVLFLVEEAIRAPRYKYNECDAEDNVEQIGDDIVDSRPVTNPDLTLFVVVTVVSVPSLNHTL
jgi:hypothetical protein